MPREELYALPEREHEALRAPRVAPGVSRRRIARASTCGALRPG